MSSRLYSRRLASGLTGLVSLVVLCMPASAQPRTERTVLTIHWGAEDFPGTATLDAHIQQGVRSRDGARVNYFAEYLENEDLPFSLEPLRTYIAQKYAGRHIDLVLAITSPAMQFVLDYRDTLFPDVPVVFLAGSTPEGVKPAAITGIISDVTWAETLELALALHPSTRRVYVVGQAPGVENYAERLQTALRPFSQRVELTYISEKSLPDLIAAVKAIPARSLILYTRYLPGSAVGLANTVTVARQLAESSPVPVYSGSALYMGTGIVGGMMRESAATGTRLGEMARRILDGTRPEDIPIERAERLPTFDWRQVQRWGIDPGRLPSGSRLLFRTPTAWEAYRGYVIGTIIVVTAQLLLIAGLLTQRAHRRSAEQTIRAREAALLTSYKRIRQLAGRLIHAQEATRASIARDLHDDVCQQLVYVSMGVSAVKSSSGAVEDLPTQETLADIDHEINRALDGVRRLSHDLHPPTLRWLGLGAALKAHCLEVEKRHEVRVSFTMEGDVGHLHPEVAVTVFRIAQESLRNAVVHGRAQQCSVSLVRAGDGVELTVTDDGCGFDLEAVRRQEGGLGLVSMEERAHMIGGEVQIDAAPGQGTTIRVRVPAEPPTEYFPEEPAPPVSAAITPEDRPLAQSASAGTRAVRY